MNCKYNSECKSLNVTFNYQSFKRLKVKNYIQRCISRNQQKRKN